MGIKHKLDNHYKKTHPFYGRRGIALTQDAPIKKKSVLMFLYVCIKLNFFLKNLLSLSHLFLW